MAEYRLDTIDELPHIRQLKLITKAYVNGWDAEKQYGGWMRIGNRVNEDLRDAAVLLFAKWDYCLSIFKAPIFQMKSLKRMA